MIFDEGRLRSKLRFAIVAPLVVSCITLSVLLAITFVHFLQTQRWVTHTHEVIIDARAIVLSAVNMETGMRGYLLAGDVEFLEPYQDGAHAAAGAFNLLKSKVADNPPQVTMVENAENAFAEWREEIAEKYIALRANAIAADDVGQITSLVAEGDGKKRFGAFRSYMRDFEEEEWRLLELRIADNQKWLERSYMAGAIGVLTLLLIGTIAAQIMSGAITAPLSAVTNALSNLSNGARLAELPNSSRKDEIGQLTAAFNALVRELLDKDRKAEAASAAKSAFLANMSHEIRTPMNGVLGMASVLRQTELSAKQGEMLDVIVQSGDALVRVLDDILDISKIEAGKLDIEYAAFDLEEFLDGIARLWALRAEEKGLELSLEVAPNLSTWVVGDSARIRQVLNNIISNAIKFTDKGSVAVRVSEHPSDTKGEVGLVFEVTDTGPGIPSGVLDNLFTVFTQADESVTRRHGGTGLGLAIAKQLSQMMGGGISVESEVAHGSTFRFYCMVRTCSGAPARPKQDLCDRQTRDDQPPRILVAEDNITNRSVLEAMLSDIGAIYTMVENGRDAVDAWESDRFDLILMDIQMPVLNGVDATQLIRAREAELSRPRTPIVAFTANVMTQQLKQYAAVGIDDYVAKPVKAPTLYRKIFSLMDGDQGTPDEVAA